MHGSVFEFVRNAAFDARNYFDHDVPGGRRIPPFVRNEFGFTNGGPVVIPGVYDGRDRTFYFGEYQGFRQVLGTTQVIPVPTADERLGIDTTTFPGDTLTVPVNPAVQAILDGYPLPNQPTGAFGDRTYATSSKVYTRTDQFSIRIDHQISNKASLLTRFSLNQVTGPLTNPDQTAINPSFGVRFFDHQRNAGVKYTRTLSPHLISETSLGYIRSTPFFPTTNHTQPAIGFADGLYQAYNQPAGSIFGSYGNLYQFKEDMSLTRGSHAFKWGAEIRVNRDSTIFGTNPNGAYDFGGGTAYCCGDRTDAQFKITSASGTHDIKENDPLPDSLTGLLTATPYSYSVIIPASVTPVGDKFDEAGVRREAYNFYFQDVWKATPQLTVNYGLRYEVDSRIHEATKRTSGPFFYDANGKPTDYWDRSATQKILINPQPPYDQDWNGWGPRLGLDYALGKHTVLHAGGSITTLIPNLWQDNFLTASIPYAFAPFITALKEYRGSVREFDLDFLSAHCLQHSRSADLRDRAFAGCAGQHGVRLLAISDRTRCADARRSGAVADRGRHCEEFRQWLHRKLDRRRGSRFRRLQVQRVVCGHGRDSSAARLLAEQFWRREHRLRALYAVRCERAGDRRLWSGVVDHQRVALDLSRSADQPVEEFRALRSGAAGELHVFEIDRRHQRGARRIVWNGGSDSANRAAGSVESFGGESGRRRSM